MWANHMRSADGHFISNALRCVHVRVAWRVEFAIHLLHDIFYFIACDYFVFLKKIMMDN